MPIHADGDGHCLVHAISRALVGRELFWHALRENLQLHFQEKLSLYQMHFQDFIRHSEWQEIIEECKPDFVPPEGELLGLRNIHIFGLANVLRRPIVLLDSIVGMRSSGDYSGVFLPTLCDKTECMDKDGRLNKPLCIAWSSLGRNHYIPLVGIEGKQAPRLPRTMLQKAWGMPVQLINEYVDFDENDCCTIGGNKLRDSYIRKLIEAMEKVYYKKNLIQPILVADTYQLLRKKSVVDNMKPDTVMNVCKELIQRNQLYHCLNCQCLNNVDTPQDWIAESDAYTQLENVLLSSYKEYLLPNADNRDLVRCEFCNVNRLRLVKDGGKICYRNGDLVKNYHGNKYYWNGVFYNNLPRVLPLILKWKTQNHKVEVLWFENESDSSLNSNAFEIGQQLVQQYFPGEFNTEALVTSLVNQILELTKIKDVGLTADAPPQTVLNPTDSSHLMHTERRNFVSDELQRDLISEKARILLQTAMETNTIGEEDVSSVASQHQQPEQQMPHQDEHKDETMFATVEMRDELQPKCKPMEHITPPQHLHEMESTILKPCETQPPTETVKVKNIRLSTSDGQKVLLNIAKDVSFKELQALISKELGIPATRQKIRMGFPPRHLCPTCDTELVLLNHGDRLDVDILPEEDDFANLQDKDVWSYIQEYPEFFQKGGIIYKYMQRQDYRSHFTIPILPGKIFCYSELDDTVQICLKAYGHFNVRPNVEYIVQQLPSNLLQPCDYHPVIHSKNQAPSLPPKARPPFSGQGRSLIALDSTSEHIPSYQRLGPGFSILGGEMSNATNSSLERIRALAENIDPQVDFSRDQDDEEEEN